MKYLYLLLAMLASTSAIGQDTQPRLVVGIVVDQMRQDYIYRYWDTFGDDGFKRIIGQGFMAHNAHYNYLPTYTGPGHASVYTGTTPSYHGIISNSWYDKARDENINCVADFSGVMTVGTEEASESRSPNYLLTTTLTDQLRIATQMRSKVISVSIKDRGAILPGGHTANLAVWFDWGEYKFITSTYYADELPEWVEEYNTSKHYKSYASKTWDLALPKEKYTASGPDNSPYEGSLKGEEPPVFPYDMKVLSKESFAPVMYSPFGNDIITDLALRALEAEQLGRGSDPDFLAIGYSSTDMLGHLVGPNAVELQDMYIRLDRSLARLLSQLDRQVGENNYTLFLTSDHGVAEVPQQNIDRKIAGGYLTTNVREEVQNYLSEELGLEDALLSVSNNQVFLDHSVIPAVDLDRVTSLLASHLVEFEDISAAYTREDLIRAGYGEPGMKGIIARGFNVERSGDLALVHPAGYLGGGSRTGTSHGTGYAYDTHIPMIFYGYGIQPGESYLYHPITDIAPTISTILRTALPNGTTGNPVSEALK